MQVWQVVVDGSVWEEVKADTKGEALAIAEEEVSAYLDGMAVENGIARVDVVQEAK